jgi:TPR repeat protein
MLEKAVALGQPQAMTRLGLFYREGRRGLCRVSCVVCRVSCVVCVCRVSRVAIV